MATKLTIIISIIASTIFRIALPYPTVIGGFIIKFVGMDSYYHANMVRQATESTRTPLYDTILYHSSSILPFHNSISLMVLPLVLHFATLFLVYLIGQKLWNKTAGAIAMLFFAVMPGEYLGRSILGNIDHHSTEVLLTTLMVYLIIMAMHQHGKKLYFTMAGITGTFVLYYLIWNFDQRIYGIPTSPALIFAGILLIFGWLALFARHQSMKFRAPMIAGILPLVMLACYMLIYFAGQLKLKTWFSTTEALPVIIPPFPLHTLMACIIVFMGIIYAWNLYRRTENYAWLFVVVWSSVILLLTIAQRRFGYYLTVNASILCALLIIRLAQTIHIRHIKWALTAIACLSMLPITYIEAKAPPTMPDDWAEALAWIRQNTTPETAIAAWWDYGYWIEFSGERTAIADNSQDANGILTVAKLLTTENTDEFAEFECLILDATTFQKYDAIKYWADANPKSPVVWDLWNGINNTTMQLVYENKTVKVFCNQIQ